MIYYRETVRSTNPSLFYHAPDGNNVPNCSPALEPKKSRDGVPEYNNSLLRRLNSSQSLMALIPAHAAEILEVLTSRTDN